MEVENEDVSQEISKENDSSPAGAETLLPAC